jgi:hypothetical protein
MIGSQLATQYLSVFLCVNQVGMSAIWEKKNGAEQNEKWY